MTPAEVLDAVFPPAELDAHPNRFVCTRPAGYYEDVTQGQVTRCFHQPESRWGS